MINTDLFNNANFETWNMKDLTKPTPFTHKEYTTCAKKRKRVNKKTPSTGPGVNIQNPCIP